MRTVQEISRTTQSILIHITEILKNKNKNESNEKGAEGIFKEIPSENFSKPGKDTDIRSMKHRKFETR